MSELNQPESDIVVEKAKDDQDYVERFKREFNRNVEHRRLQHRKNNFHYLQYKGILWLNSVYGEDYLKTIGLQVHVPRTFMTVEAIRPYLSGRPLDIKVKGSTMKEFNNSKKAEHTLKGEWNRSGADWQKADAEFYALLFGTGFLLSKYTDERETQPLYDGVDDEGKITWKDGEFIRYQGMKARSLNPYFVFPDDSATSEDDWKNCYVYSIWDFDEWKEYCVGQGFKIDGMTAGGHLEEFDAIRRRIDTIYGAANYELVTRDNGTKTTNTLEIPQFITENKIMVVERFSKNEYAICSGATWTLNHRENNPDPDKIIPIQPLRDYRVPDEFDGIGEAEVMRWQQYEENKVHNLAYMATLMSTIQRYGIIEDDLVDPTEASFSNPLKWIRMKKTPTADINKSIQALGKSNSNDVPIKFLDVIDRIRQEATGVSSYITSSPSSEVNTLGEANIMKEAGLERIRQKIYQIEERDLAPVLKHWLACIAQYYTDEMDMLLNDGEDYMVRFVPYDRQFNTDVSTVAELSVNNGISGAQTIEAVYLQMGYKEVIFVSDIIGGYNIEIKTATGVGDRQTMIDQLNVLIKTWSEINATLGYQAFDLVKAGEELGRQFPDAIKNIDEYIKPPPAPAGIPGMPPEAGGQPPAPGASAIPAIPPAPEAPAVPTNIPQ